VRIDGFTLVAQIFNFVLLVFLLKRFLYRPVLNAMLRREAAIHNQEEEARKQQEEAAEAAKAMAAEKASWEAVRNARMREIDAEIEAYRKERSQEAQAAVWKQRTEWMSALRQQQEGFLEELGDRVVKESRQIVRQILRDLADVSLETQVVRGFLRHLLDVSEDLRGALLAYVTREPEPLLRLETGFPLSEAQKREMAVTIGGWIGRPIRIDFQENPSLDLNLEFQIGEQKIAWGVSAYLEPLQKEGQALLSRGLG